MDLIVVRIRGVLREENRNDLKSSSHLCTSIEFFKVEHNSHKGSMAHYKITEMRLTILKIMALFSFCAFLWLINRRVQSVPRSLRSDPPVRSASPCAAGNRS